MLLCLDMTRDTSYNRLSAVLFLILTFLVLLTFMDYGMSWDEVRQDTLRGACSPLLHFVLHRSQGDRF